ncbi:MAG: response regulator transcription factor [Betaproteobacteria bacterium]|nr:response regulator transcription factor [Betaproteobacteria bacterium]
MDEGPAPTLVFVLEDDPAVSAVVVATLGEFGFATEAFSSAAAALRRLASETPDLFVIDLGLPDMDGMRVVQRVAESTSCGVLVLSGRGHAVDRIMGLELGADDYVVKPFEPRELVARLRSIMRRRAAAPGAGANQRRRHAAFAGCSMDCASHVVHNAAGEAFELGIAEAQVLRVFLAHPQQILSREQLLGQRDLSPLDRTIDVRISRLRRKLEVDQQRPRLIRTVYGAGYIFSATVEWS